MPMISVLPMGGAVQVLPKPGKGLSLQEIGKVEIRRSSLVEFDAERQKWYIKFIDNSAQCTTRTDGIVIVEDFGEAASKYPTDDLGEIMFGFLSNVSMPPVDSEILFFDEYDRAVRVEVYLLESWRKAGLLSED